MNATQPAADPGEEYPPELSPFGIERIEHDRMWYSHFVSEDTFFFDAYHDTVYSMTDVRSEYTFTLEACNTTGSTQLRSESAPGINPIDNVCALAGDYELGETIPLPEGELRVLDDRAFINVSGFVLEFPSKNAVSQLQDWLELSDADTINMQTLKSRVEAKAIDFTDTGADITVHYPSETPPWAHTQTVSASQPDTRSYSSEDLDIATRFVPVQRFSKWTFECPSIRKWAETHLDGRVLNVCAGQTRLNHNDGIVRNDINPDRDADIHVDAAELAAHFDPGSFDTILFDPPWSLYQSNLRYSGNHVTKGENTSIDTNALPFDIPNGREKTQLGHARLAKEGFDYLLKPGGTVLQLTFHGTCMPGRLGYKRDERVVFDPIGEGKSVIGSVDSKTQQKLTNFK